MSSKNNNTDYPINHCGMVSQIQNKDLDSDDVREEALMHAEKIIRARLAGEQIPMHELSGIQLLAVVLAESSIQAGAEKIAEDFGIDLEALKQHAASEHVSYC